MMNASHDWEFDKAIKSFWAWCIRRQFASTYIHEADEGILMGERRPHLPPPLGSR
ncbi:hypothetical protein PAXRUDRAFT_832868 [Paxillus rubicundulus Ve08.2h10]|uniref:Uncharacterized protein n=1 Tax=Paxillus rubicundulus Ve08.2h10 TaxID=930991 RepID=A0A0D0D0F7_9AGAM|nr:hypothetical protein PAXRUDRAFT_832868 [Paxillus rubicundulus Ve08.2h10]